MVVFEESVGAKLVNHTAKQIVPFRAKNYQQLSKIAEGKRGQQLSTINNNCDDHEWSTINIYYPKLQKEKEVNNYQPLSTIAMIMGGQQLFT